MQHVLDFTTRKDLGIRLKGTHHCRVIRFRQEGWVEIGSEYLLPVEESVLAWTNADIPGSILAVALKLYELEHPGTDLRAVLMEREEMASERKHAGERLHHRDRSLGRIGPHYRRTSVKGS